MHYMYWENKKPVEKEIWGLRFQNGEVREYDSKDELDWGLDKLRSAILDEFGVTDYNPDIVSRIETTIYHPWYTEEERKAHEAEVEEIVSEGEDSIRGKVKLETALDSEAEDRIFTTGA